MSVSPPPTFPEVSMGIQLSSEITVGEVQQAGGDAVVACAALVSTSGVTVDDSMSDDKVKGLISYLMRHRHGSPFEHGSLTVRVHAPVKVFREWHRHRAGWSYSEESGRYRELEPVFYIPPPERPLIRGEGFKSSDPVFEPAAPERYGSVVRLLEEGYREAYDRYQVLLELGVDRGLARDVLGVGVYSSCYCTCNPRSLMHFLELRTSSPAARRPSKPLYEIEVAAKKLEELFKSHWPETWFAWHTNGRMAP